MSYKHARISVATGLAALLVGSLGAAAATAASADSSYVATPAGDEIDGEKDILASFYDGSGLPILLRRGYWIKKRGYGWEKIKGKHALGNMTLIEGIIRNPNGGEFDPDQPSRKIYHALAQQDECVIGVGCRPVQALPMTAVVEFGRAAHYDEVLGVMTAYCENPHGERKCPMWVNRIKRIEY